MSPALNEAPLGLLFGILAGLIVLSGFFSSSETGMMSLNRYRLKHLVKSGHRGAKRSSALLERPDRLIGLILIGNNLVNILASAIATVVAIRLWGDAGIAIATITLTLVILVFAEITPKTIAALHPERIAFPASVILLPLMRVMYPLVWAINTVTNTLLKLIGVDPIGRGEENVTPEELRTIVTDAGHMIPSSHRGMLLNILDLEEVTVDDIVVPRSEVYGIDLDDDDDAIVRRINAASHTRLPVWRGDINDIIGILHLRKSARIIDSRGLDRDALERELDEPYFIPESTPLNTQLLNFQKEKKRLAVVVDEYGEMMGLVALEDILEEIVGEFTSNLTGAEETVQLLENGNYQITGTTPIRDLNKQMHWHLPTDGPRTLSGLVLEALEAFPDGDACVQIAGYRMQILELRGNVIQSVMVTPPGRRRARL